MLRAPAFLLPLSAALISLPAWAGNPEAASPEKDTMKISRAEIEQRQTYKFDLQEKRYTLTKDSVHYDEIVTGTGKYKKQAFQQPVEESLEPTSLQDQEMIRLEKSATGAELVFSNYYLDKKNGQTVEATTKLTAVFKSGNWDDYKAGRPVELTINDPQDSKILAATVTYTVAMELANLNAGLFLPQGYVGRISDYRYTRTTPRTVKISGDTLEITNKGSRIDYILEFTKIPSAPSGSEGMTSKPVAM